jgi:ubiquitin-like modifier-activating enzyme ATG7
MDKKGLLEDSARNIFGSILNGDAVRNPSVLLQFALLTFADLKSYKFTYWLGVPALLPDKAFVSSELIALKDRDSQLTSVMYRVMKDSLTTSTLPYIFAIYHPKSGTDVELPFVMDQLLTLEQAWPHCFHPAVYFVVPDSSSADNSVGWTVRNFLALLAIGAGVARGVEDGSVSTARIIGLRGAIAKRMTSVR